MNENGSSNIAPKSKRKLPLLIFFKDARLVFKMDSLAKEILGIAFPAALAIAADPIASLIDTAFIGHIGPVELAAAGVSIALFNQASKITIFPLVSITTSFVAEEDTIEKNNATAEEKQLIKNTTDKPNNAHLIQDVEKGASKEKTIEILAASGDTSKHMAKSIEHEKMERDGANTNQGKSSSVTTS
ncbi:protein DETOXIFICATION 43, partial [Sesbania bispinosa]